jgi:hypothetical protein
MVEEDEGPAVIQPQVVDATYLGAIPVNITAKSGATVTVNVTIQIMEEVYKRGGLAMVLCLL